MTNNDTTHNLFANLPSEVKSKSKSKEQRANGTQSLVWSQSRPPPRPAVAIASIANRPEAFSTALLPRRRLSGKTKRARVMGCNESKPADEETPSVSSSTPRRASPSFRRDPFVRLRTVATSPGRAPRGRRTRRGARRAARSRRAVPRSEISPPPASIPFSLFLPRSSPPFAAGARVVKKPGPLVFPASQAKTFASLYRRGTTVSPLGVSCRFAPLVFRAPAAGSAASMSGGGDCLMREYELAGGWGGCRVLKHLPGAG